MKTYKNIIRTIVALTAISLTTSCSDFLDEEDESNFTTDTYFTKAEHAESAVNGIYEPLVPITNSGFGGGTWLMLEFATGLANTSLGQATNIYLVKDLINNSDNGYGSSFWNEYYTGISRANLAIEKIPEINMDETAKQNYLAEAKFFRAYYYFGLVRMFGNIPIITESVDLTSEQLYPEQASPEAVYNLIVSDLTEAENSSLPWRDESGRVTLGAIKTLLADVYLTMGGYPLQKTENFQLAANKAKEVIDSGQYTIFDSYDDLHNPATKNTGEYIFMTQFAANIQSANWQPAILPYNLGISAYSAQTGGIFSTNEFANSYEAGDKRAEEKQFYFTSYSLEADRSDSVNLGAPYIFKHFDVQANEESAQSDLNWCIYRYSDVLLMYAEAANEAEGTPSADAYAAINEIRQRAEIADLSGLSQEAFRNAVRIERIHELSFENKTWFDMARWRKAYNPETNQLEDFVGHNFSYLPNKALTERELLFPIPTSEMQNNPNLSQNTGY
ncbi:RagB/SusD family nutrient uptake outer membrane protein [Zobellia russellii]|uniref:RagB/SusD family nutrient uptake outer membrane protein n=1 Tax=Zobellia russellii TaxID=248907 RepID=UPI001BFEEEFF|nr:RagB/SusD family nutrient uptake outer membrane protein [Zobellia russellii]MBT9189746.1 RagB/SusD family nutrient uptake outer membrane protein [Zobellia russellii]